MKLIKLNDVNSSIMDLIRDENLSFFEAKLVIAGDLVCDRRELKIPDLLAIVRKGSAIYERLEGDEREKFTKLLKSEAVEVSLVG